MPVKIFKGFFQLNFVSHGSHSYIEMQVGDISENKLIIILFPIPAMLDNCKIFF
jgi:hypothetical protein